MSHNENHIVKTMTQAARGLGIFIGVKLHMPEETFDLIAYLSSQRKAIKVEDVAEMLGVSKQAVYEYVKRGSLPALKLGSTIRLNPRDVSRWLEARMTVQPKPALRRAA